MKKIILLLVLSQYISFKCNGQTIKSIEKITTKKVNGTYYKDIEGLLNNFIGTWQYTSGNDTLKISLKKIIKYHSNYSEDLLVGEYQYVKNGVELINTLANINEGNNKIYGNWVYYYNSKPPCSDCSIDEKRIGMIMLDPVNNTVSNIYLRKIMDGNQEAISIYILNDGLTDAGGNTIDNYDTVYVGETIPNGNYVLLKQP